MPPIYKYMPEKYVEGFIRRGELLFRSLSYFKAYEEQQVNHREMLLKVGDLRRSCSVWKFAPDGTPVNQA